MSSRSVDGVSEPSSSIRGAASRPTVVVVGLGPAGPELTTPAVHDAIANAESRFLRTGRHPAAQPWVHDGVRSFDHHYEEGSSFDDTYYRIVEDLVRAAYDSGSVVYAVPGSPAVLERTVTALRDDTRVEVVTMAGLSFLDLVWDRLGIDPVNAGVRLINGENFRVDGAGERGPLLVSHTWSDEILSQIKLAVEPDDSTHAVLCHHLGLDDEQVIDVAWDELDRTIHADHLTCVYIAELARPPAYELARAAEVVATLRTKCPWDAEQTHQSLVRHLLEETYEAIEAIEELGEPPDLAASELLEEELGDVLCQVLFHATIANEEGLFSLTDVARTLADKLIHRHPHVYDEQSHEAIQNKPDGADNGDAPPAGEDGVGEDGVGTERVGAETVLANWELQKLTEKGRTSLIDGIPAALPALAYAAKLEKKMATVSFGLKAQPETQPIDSALDALEMKTEADYAQVLLAIARRAVVAGVDPETALRKGARQFRDRFLIVEKLAIEQGYVLNELDIEQRRALWDASIQQRS